MLPGLDIAIQLDNMAPLIGVPLEDVTRALRRGALAGAEIAKGIWIAGAQAALGQTSGEYIRGIKVNGEIRIVSQTLTPDTFEMVLEIVNTAPHASIVEDGHAAFHLPSVVSWNTSRVKTSKDGTRYLHIAFRHTAFASAAKREAQGYTTAAIKAMMPSHIYAEAKKLAFTTRRFEGPIHSAGGQFQQADRYNYGNRLDRSHTRPAIIMGGPGAPNAGGPGEPGFEEHRGARQVGRDAKGNPLVNPAWQTSRFHGMMRTGGPGHTSYTTIRTMTDKSLGWNIPAQSGKHIALKVATIVGSDHRVGETVGHHIAATLSHGEQ